MKLAESHVFRAAVASFWNYSSRVVGLGWTALLIARLGIADYGQYAMAVAAAAIVNAAIDNAFYVRSLRIDQDRYERERCARVLFGSVVAIAGIACFLEWYIAGFAIIVAAGELMFNTFKSQYLRVSRPDIAMRFDAVRQLVSIGLAAGAIVFFDANLHEATWLYVVPYLLIWLVCLRYVPGRKPAVPGGVREISLLSTEAFAAAVYAQGDLLVLGAIGGDRIAGYYSVALVTALAISMIGQNFANTYIEALREAKGHRSSAPPVAHIIRAALVTGAAMAAIGIGILIWGGANEVGIIALIMSLWVFARTINHIFIVILFLQHADALRVRATVVSAVVKMAFVVPAVHLMGAYGAAISCVVCELALLAWYRHVIFGANDEPSQEESLKP
ncbi:MAG: hypothetical protein ABW137_09450 [Mycobacterium sp.]